MVVATHPWAVALALLAGLTGCDDEPSRVRAASEVTTTGKVSRVDCDDDGAIYYAFNAGARQYGGKAGSRALDCATARVGDPVIVYYPPLDPSSSRVLAMSGP